MIPYLGVSGKVVKLGLLKDIANFQTLQIWIGYNAACYYNLNNL